KPEPPQWLLPVAEMLDRAPAFGGYVVVFPQYRPDLARELAHHLQLDFFNLREEVMRPRGQEAVAMSLAELDDIVTTRAASGGFVLFNVESLLAVKSETEAKAWLDIFITHDWPQPVVLPVTLFDDLVPDPHRRCCRLAAEDLPEQNLISRFLTQESA
ncbi:MAG: hypothetical protein ABFS23_13480, partial [Pseudomonadota bacterium]